MNTKIYRLTGGADDARAYEECAEIIRNGGVVAFPTETVYGLGANVFNEEACAKIFAYKKRPADKALLCHLCSAEQAEEVAFVTPTERALMKRFTPGPLTIIAPKKPCIGDVVSAHGETVGLRFPSNIEALSFIRACGLPLAATSANISDHAAPTDPKEVIADFNGVVDAILDGGVTGSGTASTIISLRDGLKILRKGDISESEIRKALAETDAE